MQANVKLLKVFTVAGVVLFVFFGLYAWHGLRYLVRRVVAPQSLHQPAQARRLPIRDLSPSKPDFHPEKLAA